VDLLDRVAEGEQRGDDRAGARAEDQVELLVQPTADEPFDLSEDPNV
jgi:hypothetical protein